MRRAGGGALAVVAALLGSACASPDAGPVEQTPTDSGTVTVTMDREPGHGLLLMSDLAADDDRFAGPAVTVQATLRMRPDECLVAVVDGVEHVPVWPVGTDIFAQLSSHERSGTSTEPTMRFGVSLPDGRALRVGDTVEGEAFTVQAVLASGPLGTPAPDRSTTPDVVTAHLAACATSAPPVAFPDAATVVTDWERRFGSATADLTPSTGRTDG